MNRIRAGTLISILMMLAAVAPPASAAVAVLEQVTGKPKIFEVGEAGARNVSLPRRGGRYTLPIEIETGAADSATFRLPDSEVSVAPDTIMRLAAPEHIRGGLLQRIFHEAGSALFSVNRRENEHFQVETPFLVSVVKGTLFTVVVHDHGATVSLHEGLLQVESPDGSRRVQLEPGEVVFSDRNGMLRELERTMAGTAPADGDLTIDDVHRATMESSLTDTADPLALEDDLTLDVDPLGGDADLLAGPGDPASGAVEVTAGLADGLADDLADSTGDLLSDTVDTAGDLLADTVETGDLLADTVETTGDLLADAGDAAGELLGGAGDATGDLLDDVNDTTGELVEDTGELTDDVLEPGGGTTDLTDVVVDTTDDVIDTTDDVVTDMTDAGGDLTGAFGDAVGGLLGGDGGDLLGRLRP